MAVSIFSPNPLISKPNMGFKRLFIGSSRLRCTCAYYLLWYGPGSEISGNCYSQSRFVYVLRVVLNLASFHPEVWRYTSSRSRTISVTVYEGRVDFLFCYHRSDSILWRFAKYHHDPVGYGLTSSMISMVDMYLLYSEVPFYIYNVLMSLPRLDNLYQVVIGGVKFKYLGGVHYKWSTGRI